MTGSGSERGMWRIQVRGAVSAATASLLQESDLSVVATMTLLETGVLPADACAATIARLQSWGLDVVEVHWKGLDVS